jgi:hypothetical protein
MATDSPCPYSTCTKKDTLHGVADRWALGVGPVRQWPMLGHCRGTSSGSRRSAGWLLCSSSSRARACSPHHPNNTHIRSTSVPHHQIHFSFRGAHLTYPLTHGPSLTLLACAGPTCPNRLARTQAKLELSRTSRWDVPVPRHCLLRQPTPVQRNHWKVGPTC